MSRAEIHDREDTPMTATTFLLMAQYGHRAVIPLDMVCRDYFSHLTTEKLLRKISAGEIPLPLVRVETSQKCVKGIPLPDLARFLDERIADARKERDQLAS
jgi:hypothetical protein